MGYEFKCMSSNSNVMSSNLQVMSSNSWVTSSNSWTTSSNHELWFQIQEFKNPEINENAKKQPDELDRVWTLPQ